MLASWCCEDAVQIRSYAYIPCGFMCVFLSNITRESIADVEILCLQDEMHHIWCESDSCLETEVPGSPRDAMSP